MMKWALYLGALPPTLMGLLVGALIATEITRQLMPILNVGLAVSLLSENPHWVLTTALTVWGVWWAIGVAAQPYLRRRGFFVFLGALGAYLLVWKLTLTLFDLRGFEALLR